MTRSTPRYSRLYEVDFIGSVLKGKMGHLGPLLRTQTNANMRHL